MKKALITLGAVVALSGTGWLAMSIAQPVLADTDAAQVAEQSQSFAIENMTCATCPITVRRAMQRVDGVHSVTIDFETKIAVAVFDPAKTSAVAIADASINVGYPATPVSE